MSIAKLTSKGRVTIPVDVRNRLRLATGDKVEFRKGPNDGSATLVPRNRTVDDVFGMLRNGALKTGPVRVEDLNGRFGRHAAV